jgi:transposase
MMCGRFEDQGKLFSYISPETRVPADHPLRAVREIVRFVLRGLDRDFAKVYKDEDRPSIMMRNP